jgi:molybdopterin-binding protein
MTRETYSAREAANALGVSIDTLRRWDRQGKIHVDRDLSDRRVIPASEIERLRSDRNHASVGAENRFRGTVTHVALDGLLAHVGLAVDYPVRIVAVISREAAEELGLHGGTVATVIVDSTSVMVERK